jgi:hypothetical protein
LQEAIAAGDTKRAPQIRRDLDNKIKACAKDVRLNRRPHIFD